MARGAARRAHGIAGLRCSPYACRRSAAGGASTRRSRAIARGIRFHVHDRTIIDGVLINGSASAVGAFARLARGIQAGYIYRYAFAMVIGVCLLLVWRLGFK